MAAFLKNAEVFHLGYSVKGPSYMDMSLSLSLKTVLESLFKISLEHHSFVPEHFLKIDCEVRLLAAKNYAACANCFTFRLAHLCVCGSREVQVSKRWFHKRKKRKKVELAKSAKEK